jgi:tripartite-type tricarboxylate transporter receptor subunit TctC
MRRQLAALNAAISMGAPKGTPQAVIARLEAAIRNTVEGQEFKDGCERLGARPSYAPALAFGDIIAKEDARLAELMETIGLNKRADEVRKRAER